MVSSLWANKKPFYRLFVTEKRRERAGRFVESIVYYVPCRNPADVKIDRERVKYWLGRGPQPSETVRNLIKRKVEPSNAGPVV